MVVEFFTFLAECIAELLKFRLLPGVTVGTLVLVSMIGTAISIVISAGNK